jgi:protein gp37
MFRDYPRLKRLGLPTYQWNSGQIRLHEEMLEKPLHWKQPRMIFTNSMSDFFHEKVPFEFLDKVLEIIRKTPQHTYQVLTKRSWRMMKYSQRIGGFPANVWCGVSVESNAYGFRIAHLRKADAEIRFISIEPLIGPIGEVDLSGVDWVIVGGESGPIRRPCKIEWVREIRDKCISSEVAFFFKQWGGSRAKSGGRILDGRTWDEFPVFDMVAKPQFRQLLPVEKPLIVR